jgi:hypothetical protein
MISAAHCFAKDWDRAFETAFEYGKGAWWHKQAEVCELVLETGDLDLVERFLQGAAPQEMTRHSELLDKTIEACAEADAPERAWDFLDYFSGISLTGAQETTAAQVAESKGVEAACTLLRAGYDRNIERGWTDSAVEMLAIWGLYDPDAVTELLGGFLQGLDPWNKETNTFLRSMSRLLPLLGFEESAQELIEAAPRGEQWLALLGTLTPEDSRWPEAFEEGLAAAERHGQEKLLEILKPFPEFYEQATDRLLEEAGRDRLNLERLVRSFAGVGDLVNANVARMRCRAADRAGCNQALARGAILREHYSAALTMLDELKPGYAGTGGREYEAVRAIVIGLGDKVQRVAWVL